MAAIIHVEPFSVIGIKLWVHGLLPSQMTHPCMLLYVNKGVGMLGDVIAQIWSATSPRIPGPLIYKRACEDLSFINSYFVPWFVDKYKSTVICHLLLLHNRSLAAFCEEKFAFKGVYCAGIPKAKLQLLCKG